MAKKNKSEEQLKKLCASRGAITKFQKSMKILLNENTAERDQFDLLREMVILVTLFQDKQLKTLTKIKEGLKTENLELFPKFGKFYATVKICGRDMHKTDKHHTFVSNQATVRRLKIGKRIHYSPTDLNIYLSSEFYIGALSLQQVKEYKGKKNLGKYHNLMMEDMIQETKKFIKNNGKILGEPLF
jgi:hypothetical protein